MKKVNLYIAEALGTFALVFVGTGSYLMAVSGTDIGIFGVALAHGLVLMAVVYSFGMISGAHVNPAVTFAMWISGKMETWEGLKYILAQLLGAVFASLAIKVFLIYPPTELLGTPMLAKQITLWQGLAIEAILTFFLTWVVLATTDKKFPPAASGLTIGLTLTFGILVAGALTGGALNPARAFGPAVVSGYWTNHLIYWAGPLLGALLAAMMNKLLRK